MAIPRLSTPTGFFGRKFPVLRKDRPTFASVRIAADTRYELWAGHILVGKGPAPSAKGITSYDEYDNVLLVGYPNCEIRVIVNYVGVPMFFYHRNRGGLLFELTMTNSDKESPTPVNSDATWQVASQSPYDPSSPRWSVQQGFAEYRDLRQGTGSHPFKYVPDEWRMATVIEPAYGGIWPKIQDRGISLSRLDNVAPSALLGYGNCVSPENENVALRLQNEELLPLTSGSVSINANQNKITIQPDDKNIWLLFDMGREVSGYPWFLFSTDDGGNSDVTVDFGYDEAFRPGETPSGLKHSAAEARASYADQLKFSGSGDFSPFAPRAFRYLRLAIRGLDSQLKVEFFGVNEISYPVEHPGSFSCSDARLDRLWEIGWRTLQLCIEDRFMDCPLRERAQWMGDARVQAIGARYCFGDSLLHKRFLRQTALSQYPDGKIDPVGPGEWDAFEPNRPIAGFVAIYILSVYDYYLMTADGDLVKEVMPAVQKALGWLGSFGASEGGLLTNVTGWNFTDWAPGLSNASEGINAPVNLFYLLPLRAASRLAEAAGDTATASSTSTRADMIARAFDSLFWNSLRGAYVDNVIKGEQSTISSQHTNTLALLCEIGAETRRRSIAERIMEDETLTQIGSPYFSFYLVHALAKIGWHQDALDYIRDKWGEMMDAGATTFWEHWDGSESRCHAWSIAPNIWLPQQLAGVTAHEPGFACVNIAPKPCDLTWLRAIVPIPQGDVCVSWLKSDDDTRFTLDVSVPTGVHIRPILPCGPDDLLYCDGELVDPDSIVRRVQTGAELAVLPGSGYRFEVVST